MAKKIPVDGQTHSVSEFFTAPESFSAVIFPLSRTKPVTVSTHKTSKSKNQLPCDSVFFLPLPATSSFIVFLSSLLKWLPRSSIRAYSNSSLSYVNDFDPGRTTCPQSHGQFLSLSGRQSQSSVNRTTKLQQQYFGNHGSWHSLSFVGGQKGHDSIDAKGVPIISGVCLETK